jgi:hypothetical protein
MAARNLQGRLRANSWNRSATVISKKEKKKAAEFHLNRGKCAPTRKETLHNRDQDGHDRKLNARSAAIFDSR